MSDVVRVSLVCGSRTTDCPALLILYIEISPKSNSPNPNQYSTTYCCCTCMRMYKDRAKDRPFVVTKGPCHDPMALLVSWMSYNLPFTSIVRFVQPALCCYLSSTIPRISFSIIYFVLRAQNLCTVPFYRSRDRLLPSSSPFRRGNRNIPLHTGEVWIDK